MADVMRMMQVVSAGQHHADEFSKPADLLIGRPGLLRGTQYLARQLGVRERVIPVQDSGLAGLGRLQVLSQHLGPIPGSNCKQLGRIRRANPVSRAAVLSGIDWKHYAFTRWATHDTT